VRNSVNLIVKLKEILEIVKHKEVRNLECEKCGREFEFPAFRKEGATYHPVCPYCAERLYRKP